MGVGGWRLGVGSRGLGVGSWELGLGGRGLGVRTCYDASELLYRLLQIHLPPHTQ